MRAAAQKAKDDYRPQQNDSMCLRWESDRNVEFYNAYLMAVCCCDKKPGFMTFADCSATYLYCLSTTICTTAHCLPDAAWRAGVGTALCCTALTDGCCGEAAIPSQERTADLCHSGFFACGPRSEAMLENYLANGYRALGTDPNFDKYQSGPLAQQVMR